MKINESAENYLEAIFMLKKESDFVRSIDIAHELEFTKASVSVAMKSFREKGYITIDENGGISLTDIGQQIAEKVYERHHVIASLLISLGVSKETAFEDSCKIEHVISDESFEKLKSHMYTSLKKEV